MTLGVPEQKEVRRRPIEYKTSAPYPRNIDGKEDFLYCESSAWIYKTPTEKKRMLNDLLKKANKKIDEWRKEVDLKVLAIDFDNTIMKYSTSQGVRPKNYPYMICNISLEALALIMAALDKQIKVYIVTLQDSWSYYNILDNRTYETINGSLTIRKILYDSFIELLVPDFEPSEYREISRKITEKAWGYITSIKIIDFYPRGRYTDEFFFTGPCLGERLDGEKIKHVGKNCHIQYILTHLTKRGINDIGLKNIILIDDDEKNVDKALEKGVAVVHVKNDIHRKKSSFTFEDELNLPEESDREISIMLDREYKEEYKKETHCGWTENPKYPFLPQLSPSVDVKIDTDSDIGPDFIENVKVKVGLDNELGLLNFNRNPELLGERLWRKDTMMTKAQRFIFNCRSTTENLDGPLQLVFDFRSLFPKEIILQAENRDPNDLVAAISSDFLELMVTAAAQKDGLFKLEEDISPPVSIVVTIPENDNEEYLSGASLVRYVIYKALSHFKRSFSKWVVPAYETLTVIDFLPDSERVCLGKNVSSLVDTHLCLAHETISLFSRSPIKSFLFFNSSPSIVKNLREKKLNAFYVPYSFDFSALTEIKEKFSPGKLERNAYEKKTIGSRPLPFRRTNSNLTEEDWPWTKGFWGTKYK